MRAARPRKESQFFPHYEPGDPGPQFDCSELDRSFGSDALYVGVGATVFGCLVLLAVMFRGLRWRLFASVLYGPLLLWIGIVGLRHPDLHRWAWGSSSLVAGAILIAFGASHWFWRWSGLSRERASNVALTASCALALLFASFNLPAQSANRVLSTSSLSWTYHLAEWKRDPYERIQGYTCTTHAGRCDCFKTGKEDDRGSCGDERCCYEWNNLILLPNDGLSYPDQSGCFCVSVDPALRFCPTPSSFPPAASNASNWRSETCP